MNQVILGLGSNLGDKKSNLNQAITLIEQWIGKTLKISGIYETQAWGVENQDNYFNMAVQTETKLWPLEILKNILLIEKNLGRVRTKKWESRLIDIDILLFNDIVINTPDLIIPHPYLHQRRFVLHPLLDLDPNMIHPQFHKIIESLSAECKDNSWIQKLNN